MPWCYLAKGFLLGSLLIAAGVTNAEGFHLESTGARFGFYASGAGSHFYQADVFANSDLPWGWDLGSRWSLQSRFDGSIGWLGDSFAGAAIISVGPSLSLRCQNLPVSLEAGLSGTVLSRSDFRDKDFGTLFQFTSHAGLNFDVTRRIQLGYRFQHMSNAGLGRHNPGLNLHMFGLSYLF